VREGQSKANPPIVGAGGGPNREKELPT